MITPRRSCLAFGLLATLGLASTTALAQSKPSPSERSSEKPQAVVERSRLEVQPSGKPIAELSIENPLGDVIVEGYSGDSLQIETRKEAPDIEGIDRLRVSLVPNPDGTVRIKTTADGGKDWKPLARSAVRIDLVVRAPHAARIRAVSSAGKVEVSKMDGGGELDTATGAIRVSNVQGDFATSTVSGDTTLSVVFGSVDAQALSSNVELDSIGGERLVATVNRGRIAGRRVRSREVELTTTDGAITLEGEAALRGRMVVASLRGDVEVRLRRPAAVALDIRARGAKVSFGGAAASVERTPSANGWVAAHLGRVAQSEAPALVELRSARGNVQFVVVE